jgi:hypothetical protein
MPEIIQVSSKKDLLDFIRFPFSLYKDDPLFCPLPVMEQKKVFSPLNPFFNYAEIKFFLLKEQKKILGRIISIVNKRHLAMHNDGAGFFGFFECIDDPKAAGLLLDAVRAELKKSGLRVVRGPMNFSTNEECGFLAEGFGRPPMIMTPYNPPYYNSLMEQCGLTKAKDLLAFILDMPDTLPAKINRVADIAEKRGIRVRPAVMRRLKEELMLFKEIYNSSWKDNWGFIPIANDELHDMAKRLKGILVPELTLIAEHERSPVGFMALVPDFNQVLARIKGKLGPVEIMKAFYYSRRIDALRLMLLGVKEEWRNKGVDALLFAKGFEGILGIKGRPYKKVEFSWLVEDNLPVIRLTEMIGARLYKKFRVYEKEV